MTNKQQDAVERAMDALIENGVSFSRFTPKDAFRAGFDAGLAHRDEWRYVEDWLPEDAGWYLVTAIEQFEDTRTTTSFFVNGYWNRKVIAWMPLPEPAKPRGER